MDQPEGKKPLPTNIRNWEALRGKGKARFILLTGVLAYGGTMFVVMTFFANRRADRPLNAMNIGIAAVIWLLGGAAFGWAMWKINERRYQKFLAANGGKQ